VSDARALVEQLLAGEVTEENAPHLFEDDVLYLRVATLEKSDADWLLDRVRDRDVPLERRLSLVRQMSALHERAMAIVREEDPSIRY
jgi:hypothetical protein